jgi:hypothetical protein
MTIATTRHDTTRHTMPCSLTTLYEITRVKGFLRGMAKGSEIAGTILDFDTKGPTFCGPVRCVGLCVTNASRSFWDDTAMSVFGKVVVPYRYCT